MEQDAIRRLAADIPALWHAPGTTVAERKEIIRQVVERVEVTVAGESERVGVAIAWAGGSQTTGMLIRPVGRLEQLSYYPQLCARVRTLVAEGRSAAAVAAQLHAEGYRPPKRSTRFDWQAVQDLIQRLGLRPRRPQRPATLALGSDEWWVADLAQALEMPRATVESWIKRGWVQARRQVEVHGQRRRIVWADQDELDRLRRQRQRPAGAVLHDHWTAREQGEDGARGR